ncbi:guanine nucleotide-binding protein-like 3 isoform X2 [Hypanus sabinus]|uniref:guanine nucleotide-binding protein-like 3 isoform X2 n=1 Tax=Hypanus sabinus TaxID=79690 RepID=UPI0028C3C6AF|nr:guanine nucleotide-binding protein-like 3 isoform X2 [Hypanus sabinus]
MKRPKLKKASKRLSCRKKYKIQRKVREHKRKVRKEAKKKGNKTKKFRKDPGVPNDAPFKEDILHEAEQRKQKLEELKQKQKLARQKEVAKKRKLESKKGNPDIIEKPLKCAPIKEQKALVKFEEKNSRESLGGELNKVIDASDVVLEVVDARDPLGYRCPQVEQAILRSEGKKQLVLVINKIGFPNVGKSSIINTLKKMRACNVGQMKGLTKSMQEIHIDKRIKLLDSPSIIASPSNSAIALALRNIVSVDAFENPTAAVEHILKNCNKQQVILQYNVPDFRTPLEFLILLAQKRSILKKGGMPDLEKAAKLILSDWTGTKISYYTRPPATEITTKHVDEAKSGFNIGEITKGNMNTLKVVRCPNAASSIIFHSTGPTNGILAKRNSKELQNVGEEEDDDDEEGSERKLI